FRVLLLGFTVTVFGSNTVAAVASYYVTYVLESDRLPLFFGLFFGAGISAMPFWLWLSNRLGRKAAWLWAYAVNTLPFAPVAFLGQGDDLPFAICFTLAGFGGVPVIALFPAMQADVIDDDESRCGERREGLFIGLWSVAEKFSAGVAVAIALGALGLAGYVPNIEQTDAVLGTLVLLFVGVPCLCNSIGFGLALCYTLAPSTGVASVASANSHPADPLDPMPDEGAS
ncbi:MAG: GPH family glycoside/pentoside/hexuronide:cation symporter, partial [Myxococcota bacterium]